VYAAAAQSQGLDSKTPVPLHCVKRQLETQGSQDNQDGCSEGEQICLASGGLCCASKTSTV
jgi:hypothetical protein